MRNRAAAIFLLSVAGSAGVSCTAALAGPVGISPDHRSFVDGEGRPSFWLGDTLWELFMSYPAEDAEVLLEDRRGKGFSAIQVMLLGVGGGKKPNVQGERPFLNGTLSTPNEGFFSAVDAIVRIAARKNLVLVIGLYHKSPEYGTMITRENARAWGAWVGRRFRSAPNVIWSMYPEAKDSCVPLVRELAAGLAEGDGGSHLITVHPDPSPASSSWIHTEPWLSFNTLQSWKSTHLNYEMVAADYARTPVKPVVNGEARYEAEGGTTPLDVRKGAWWSCLAGGFYTFGHGGNWMKPAGWRDWIDSPASRQMKVLGDFLRSLDWWTLVPDQTVISGDAGERAAARSRNRDWAIVYLPSGGMVSVDLGALRTSGSAHASWMDPATGRRESAGSFPAAGTHQFTPPQGLADAVLLLQATLAPGP